MSPQELSVLQKARNILNDDVSGKDITSECKKIYVIGLLDAILEKDDILKMERQP